MLGNTNAYFQYLQVGFFQKNPIGRFVATAATAAADDDDVSNLL